MATRLGDAELGTQILLPENGEDKAYLVYHHGAFTTEEFSSSAAWPTAEDYCALYSGFENVTLVLRENSPPYQFQASMSETSYSGGLIQSQVSQTYNALSEDIKNLSCEVTVPIACYRSSPSPNYYLSTLTGPMTIPSAYEIPSVFPSESDRAAIADSGGEVRYWLRDVNRSEYRRAFVIEITGAFGALLFRESCYHRPLLALDSNAWITDDGHLVANTPPEITGTDGDLGSFGETSPTYNYTVTDEQGGTVSVTEALDGVTLRTYNVTLGQQNTLTIPSATYLTTLNGTHTLTITATDSVGASTTRTETFTKDVTSCAFTQTTAFTADDMPTRCVINIQGAFPEGSTLTVQICNNGNDASPTWETITQQALLGQKYFFQNETKTAANWGVKVQASLARGTAEGDCYISSIGGVFQ